MKKVETFFSQNIKNIASTVALIFLTMIISFGLLEYTCINSLSPDVLQRILDMEGKYIIINFLTLAALLSALFILFHRVWLACAAMTAVCGMIGIINYYVIQFHTMPLSFLVLKNFGTAMDAVASYKILPEKTTIIAFLMIIAMIFLCVWIGRKREKQPDTLKKRLMIDLLLAVFAFSVMYNCYFNSNTYMIRGNMGWSWQESYGKYGFVACTVESYRMSLDVVAKPEGYSESYMQTIEIESGEKEETVTPDIILILNETFYDLRQITDMVTDVPYLENIEQMENLLYGYAIVPGAGGGTNNTEYELLTSNSMNMITGTPFNYMDLYGAESIVSHLNDLGYSTLGSHSEPGLNYSRITGYRALNFQRCYFEEYFNDLEFMPGRWYETDKTLYKNLIKWYEETPGENPRFLYMLTIQNHGEWNWSDPENDIVHTLKDYGEETQAINEYLTGIYLSDIAFRDLTEYFSQVDRPVIICMLGDHSPNFVGKIMDKGYTEAEQALLTRKVPLMIWANYPLREQELGTMSVNYVVPTLLDIAGVQISPYYSYLLNMKKQIPILSAYGDYYDKNGNCYNYGSDEGMEFEKLVDDYFRIEYHNIKSSENRNWFAPYGQ